MSEVSTQHTFTLAVRSARGSTGGAGPVERGAEEFSGIEAAAAVLRRAHASGLRDLANAERDSLAFLYRSLAADGIKVALRYVDDRADAEDVVHEVFVRLPVTINRYHQGNFAAWLGRVIARSALGVGRRRRREIAFPSSIDSVAADVEPLDEEVQRPIDVRAFWRAVSRLPSELERVVTLRVFNEKTHEAISLELGISQEASQVRLCRAVKLLRRAMVRPGNDLSPTPARRRSHPRP